jgi:hypothetical protein
MTEEERKNDTFARTSSFERLDIFESGCLSTHCLHIDTFIYTQSLHNRLLLRRLVEGSYIRDLYIQYDFTEFGTHGSCDRRIPQSNGLPSALLLNMIRIQHRLRTPYIHTARGSRRQTRAVSSTGSPWSSSPMTTPHRPMTTLSPRSGSIALAFGTTANPVDVGITPMVAVHESWAWTVRLQRNV